jgi:PAS domain S-box-containing protein
MRVVESDRTAPGLTVVLDSLPIESFLARPDGEISFVSKALSALTGQPHDVIGDAHCELIFPGDRERAMKSWEIALATRTHFRTEIRFRFGSGSYRWILSRASPLYDASTGAISGWLGIVTDIQESKENEERLVAQANFTNRLLDSSEDCIKVLDLDGNVVAINSPGRRLLKIPDTIEPRGTFYPAWWSEPQHRRAAQHALDAARRGESERFDGMMEIEGQRRWFDTVACPILGDTGLPERLLVLTRDITEKRQTEKALERVAQGLLLLSRTGAAVRTLDYRITLENIARACILGFSTGCIIDAFDAFDDSSGWERIVAHENPGLELAIKSLARPDGMHPIARTIATGRSEIVTFSKAWVETIDANSARRKVIDELSFSSAIVVPMKTPDDRVIGALTLVVTGNALHDDYGADDIRFVEEVGRRAGAAIANARLFNWHHRIASELQAASLPVVPRRLQDLELDVCYRPGSDESYLAGDWYDAFPLEDGRVAITVGDVLGHGLHAAIIMTKLRQAMQSAAMIDPNPSVMLTVADRTLRMFNPDTYATALAAIYDRDRGTLAIASAGHPGPIIRSREGDILEYTVHGTMLGLGGPTAFPIRTIFVRPESTLVFYTDGLVEATRDCDAGLIRLRDAIDSPGIIEAAQPARAIVQYVLAGGEARDDIAVLVARVRATSENRA